jgi:hypothetical protein
MLGIGRTEQTYSLIQSFSGARSALEEVFQYYKVGRHTETFLEKPYFLLSRCAHLLFSLWLAEQESEQGLFCLASPPAAFALGLDFGELRYTEYKRRMLHEDQLEEHLTNETKWFEFWMRLLQQFDSANAPVYQELCRRLLAWVREPGLLEGKVDRRSRKALHVFLTGDETGRVLLGTMRVLEDFLRAMVGSFATPAAKTCAVEQVILLTGLLHEIRRIIIRETPAQGPYVLFRRARWHSPSPWQRLRCRRTPGLLMVVPKREGGEIVCTFQPVPDSKGRRISWVRTMASLEGTYEAELFATWSYGSGELQEHPDQSPDRQACWTLQNAEARRLEALAKQIDRLLDVLQQDPVCTHLVAAVRRVSRNDAPEWTAAALPWTYISQLDQLLGKLTFVYREAKAVGGDDSAQSVIEQIWPSGNATTGGGDRINRHNSGDERASHGSPSAPVMESARTAPTQAAPGTLASLLQRLGGRGYDTGRDGVSKPQGPSILPESAMQEPDQGSESPSPARQAQGTEQEQEPRPLPSAAHAEHNHSEAESESRASGAAAAPEQPDSAGAAESAASVPAPEGAAAPAPRKRPRQRPTPAQKAANTDRPAELDQDRQALLGRLLEHHEWLGRTINYDPLSPAELQRDLGWSASKVRRVMTNVFGPKPVNAYRKKCEDRTISTFLKAQAGGKKTHRTPTQARPQKAGKAPRASAKASSRRKSSRRSSVHT